MKDEVICVWPDGTWCEFEYLEEYLEDRSDDYEVLTVVEAVKRGIVDPDDVDYLAV